MGCSARAELVYGIKIKVDSSDEDLIEKFESLLSKYLSKITISDDGNGNGDFNHIIIAVDNSAIYTDDYDDAIDITPKKIIVKPQWNNLLKEIQKVLKKKTSKPSWILNCSNY